MADLLAQALVGDAAEAHSTIVGFAEAAGAEFIKVVFSALLVAVVGVAGTMVSPVLTQYFSRRARQQEIDAAITQRLDEQGEERRRVNLQERRECYIRLNTAARRHRQALVTLLFERTTEARTALDDARRVYSDAHAECQLVAPVAVLEADSQLSIVFGTSYGRVIDFVHDFEGLARAKDRQDDISEYIKGTVAAAIQRVREEMRSDLGVTQADAGGAP